MVHCPTPRPVLSGLWDTNPGKWSPQGKTGVVYSMKMKGTLRKEAESLGFSDRGTSSMVTIKDGEGS